MTESKKRDKQTAVDEHSEISTAVVMSQFAEDISQNILERDLNDIDSFELYVHQLRTHLHTNHDVFKFRFSEGYRVLLEELEKESII